MYLVSETLAPYLLNRGTVAREAVVDGGFMVVEACRRNRNFKIYLGRRGGLFVKQASRRDRHSAETLRREAAFYQLLQTQPDHDMGSLRTLVPHLMDYDPVRAALTLELLCDGQSMSEIVLGRVELSPHLASIVGAHLAHVHGDIAVDALSPEADGLFPRRCSSSLCSIIAGVGPAPLRELSRRRTIVDRLAELHRSWHFTHLVHNDLKPDNIQVCGPPDVADPTSVKLVDWELVDVGDPAWDLACVLVGLLHLWVIGSVAQEELGGLPDELLQGRTTVPPSIADAAAAFWREYVAHRGLDVPARRQLAERCGVMLGARLAVVAFEMSFERAVMPTTARVFADLAERLLADPAIGPRLLGLNPASTREAESCPTLR